MALTAKIYVDGGCRGNGTPDSIGAAAAWIMRRWGERKYYATHLPNPDMDGFAPTNQRAELVAIGHAFRLLKEQLREDNSRIPRLDIEIFSDSKYAIGCMTEWADRWKRNGWRHSDGTPVANWKLIKRTLDLENEFLDFARVSYTWIPRSENERADRLCHEAMDAEWREIVRRKNRETAQREAAARRAREERLRIAREEAEEKARREAEERRPTVRIRSCRTVPSGCANSPHDEKVSCDFFYSAC